MCGMICLHKSIVLCFVMFFFRTFVYRHVTGGHLPLRLSVHMTFAWQTPTRLRIWPMQQNPCRGADMPMV